MSSPADWSRDVWIAVCAGGLAAAVLVAGGIYMAVRRGARARMQSVDMSKIRMEEQRSNGFGPSSWSFGSAASAEAPADSSVDMPLLTLKNGVGR